MIIADLLKTNAGLPRPLRRNAKKTTRERRFRTSGMTMCLPTGTGSWPSLESENCGGVEFPRAVEGQPGHVPLVMSCHYQKRRTIGL